MAAGKPKHYSAAEIKKRKKRLAEARKKRWASVSVTKDHEKCARATTTILASVSGQGMVCRGRSLFVRIRVDRDSPIFRIALRAGLLEDKINRRSAFLGNFVLPFP
jgi:hypothetical protein